MKISKLMNYSTDMCWNGQGTTRVEYGYFRIFFPPNMATLVHFFHKNPLCMSELHWIFFGLGGVMDHGPYLPIHPSGFRVC